MEHTLVRLTAIVFCCLGVGLTGCQSPNAQPAHANAFQSKTVAACSQLSPENWSLKLESIRLNANGVAAVEATLYNNSNERMTIADDFARISLHYGIRIWREDLSGSYRMRMKRGISVNSGPRAKMIVLGPGESFRITFGELSSPASNDDTREWSIYEVVYGLLHSVDPKNAKKTTLPAGRYVVDAAMRLTEYPESATSILEMLGTVTVCSDNKLWVDVPGTATRQATKS